MLLERSEAAICILSEPGNVQLLSNELLREVIYELAPGDVFAIAPGHDSWVIGEEPYVSLHFLGAEAYAG